MTSRKTSKIGKITTATLKTGATEPKTNNSTSIFRSMIKIFKTTSLTRKVFNKIDRDTIRTSFRGEIVTIILREEVVTDKISSSKISTTKEVTSRITCKTISRVIYTRISISTISKVTISRTIKTITQTITSRDEKVTIKDKTTSKMYRDKVRTIRTTKVS